MGSKFKNLTCKLLRKNSMKSFGFYLRVSNLLLPSFIDLVLQKSATKATSINAAGD